MARYLLILIFLLLANPNYAVGPKQDSIKHPFVIGFKTHYGSIIIHSRAIREIKDSYPFGIEADFSWHLNGEKQWNNCRCYPRVGVMFSYFYYDNPSVLGNGIAAIYYVEPFFGAHRKLSLSFRAGAGQTYLTRPYDEATNPDNQSYSTHLNTFLITYLTLNYRVNEKININASGCFNHISNGGVRQPNKGINFPTASIGVDYTFRPQAFLKRDKIKFKATGKRIQRLEMALFGNLKSYSHREPREHVVWGSSIHYSYQVGRLSALTGSAELMANGVVKEEMKREGIDGKSHVRVGILGGYELLMGKYRLSTQMGIYAFRPYRDNNNDLLYQRYKLTYRFNNGFYTGISLKAHRHVADYFDFRIGYSFRKIKAD